MSNLIYKLFSMVLILSVYLFSFKVAANQTEMVEDIDGDLKIGEYRIIDSRGSVTRSLCPYTCEMKGVPPKHCKEWGSAVNKEECYVQDLRISKENSLKEKNYQEVRK